MHIYDDGVLSNIITGFMNSMDNSQNQLHKHIDTIEWIWKYDMRLSDMGLITLQFTKEQGVIRP